MYPPLPDGVGVGVIVCEGDGVAVGDWEVDMVWDAEGDGLCVIEGVMLDDAVGDCVVGEKRTHATAIYILQCKYSSADAVWYKKIYVPRVYNLIASASACRGGSWMPKFLEYKPKHRMSVTAAITPAFSARAV